MSGSSWRQKVMRALESSSAGRATSAGCGAKSSGRPPLRLARVPVHPLQEGRIAQVGCEALEQVLGPGIEEAARDQQAAVLEHAHVDRLQHPEHRGAAGQEIGPHVEIVAHLLVAVQAARALLHGSGGTHLGAEVVGDSRDVLAKGGGQAHSIGWLHVGPSRVRWGRIPASFTRAGVSAGAGWLPRGATWEGPR